MDLARWCSPAFSFAANLVLSRYLEGKITTEESLQAADAVARVLDTTTGPPTHGQHAVAVPTKRTLQFGESEQELQHRKRMKQIEDDYMCGQVNMCKDLVSAAEFFGIPGLVEEIKLVSSNNIRRILSPVTLEDNTTETTAVAFVVPRRITVQELGIILKAKKTGHLDNWSSAGKMVSRAWMSLPGHSKMEQGSSGMWTKTFYEDNKKITETLPRETPLDLAKQSLKYSSMYGGHREATKGGVMDTLTYPDTEETRAIVTAAFQKAGNLAV